MEDTNQSFWDSLLHDSLARPNRTMCIFNGKVYIIGSDKAFDSFEEATKEIERIQKPLMEN
jgi:hypothetical protein